MIDYFHKNYHPWDKPRTYRADSQKEYLALAKSKKRTEKKNTRQQSGKQLGYVGFRVPGRLYGSGPCAAQST